MADHSDDLDQLLDTALDDFQNLNLSKPSLERSKEAVETKRQLPSLPAGIQGLGMGLPDLKAKKNGKQKVAGGSHVTEALDKLREQTREAVRGLETMSEQPGGDDFTKDPMMIKSLEKHVEALDKLRVHLSARELETMSAQPEADDFTRDPMMVKQLEEIADKLRELTRRARGLETMSAQPGADDFTRDPMMEHWVKQFEEFAEARDKVRKQTRMSAQPGADDFTRDPMMEHWVKQFEEFAEARDKVRKQTRMSAQPGADDWFNQFEEVISGQDLGSIWETSMQYLLSEENYGPMKEIGEKYLKWLKDNEATLSKEEYDRCFHHCEFIKELNEVYKNDSGNYNKIFEINQKMLECGPIPDAVLQELTPDFDLAILDKYLQTPDMLESQGNCCIM